MSLFLSVICSFYALHYYGKRISNEYYAVIEKHLCVYIHIVVSVLIGYRPPCFWYDWTFLGS